MSFQKHKIYVLATLLALTQLVGCAVRPRLELESAPAEPTAEGDAYVPEFILPVSTEETDEEYKLGPGDKLTVKFFNNEELNEEVTVRPDGRISLQRVGDIPVNGLTPTQLTQVITQKYTDILLDPGVTVIVDEFGGNTVYVLGEVSAPGNYQVQRNMTMIRALAAAGGPTDEASLSSVILIRLVAKDRISATRVDLSIPMLHHDPSLDLSVRAFDIIYVPKTFIANIRSFVTQIYDTILPPLDLYARSVFWSNAWK